MADTTPAGVSTIPSAISIIKPTHPDRFHPIPIGVEVPPEEPEAGPSKPSEHDYTENVPQAVFDAIAHERAREAQEGPADMMVGSFQSWSGDDHGMFLPLSSEGEKDGVLRTIP